MANFNQSPLGQESVGIGTIYSFDLGSDTSTASTLINSISYTTDGSGFIQKIDIPGKIVSSVRPSRRRPGKIILDFD